MNQLTVPKLKAMKPGKIFKAGVITDNPEGVNMMNTNRVLRYVACRGQGYHDWAIYCYYDDEGWTEEMIQSNGQKITGEANIKKLVPCDDKAYELYRL